MNKLTPAQKDKIVHLWKHKRAQRKARKSRYFWKRLSFVLFFFAFNGALLWFAFQVSSPDPLEAIQINYDAELQDQKSTFTELQIERQPFWLFTALRYDIAKQLTQLNPLIASVQAKPLLNYPDQSKLKIEVQSYIPWARFSHGWILGFWPEAKDLKIITQTKNLDFDQISFASSVLIMCPNCSQQKAEKYAPDLQNLIYTLTTSLPEKPLRAISLQDETILYFDDLYVSLGKLDPKLKEKAKRVISLQKTLKKYENEKIQSLDLRNPRRAILKRKNALP
jgi:cell division septal protein FtsQ